MESRAAALRRDLDFLQQQHRETLRDLHREIERLKRLNKELQFKLKMEPPKSYREDVQGSGHTGRNDQTEVNGFQSEREVCLWQTSNFQQEKPGSQTADGDKEFRLSELTAAGGNESGPEATQDLITSLHPLRICSSPFQPPRAPNLQECEVIIRQLHKTNSLQAQEILRIKAVLRDIVLKGKITPENYFRAKACLADGKRDDVPERLPKLLLHVSSKGLEDRPVYQASVVEKVILPALKQSFIISFAERQRRTREVQRSYLWRTVKNYPKFHI